MYSKAKPPSTSAMTLSSSLPPSFNFCEYMEEQAPLSAASLSSLPEVSPPTRVRMAQQDQQIPPYATKYFESSNPQQASSKANTNSAKYQQPPMRSQNQFRAHQATDLATNYQHCDPSTIPDCSYFPFFVDPKLEQNIFDLPSDCDLQNYGVSLLDFLHKTFETPTSNEITNDFNASAETLLTNQTTDGCFRDFAEDYTGNFNGSLLRKHSSCPRATMSEDDHKNQCDSKPDSYKPFPKPVTAVTMRQEPIVAQRACSRPVDKPMPQFARSFDVNSALNAQVAKTNSANKSIKPNFDLVSAGQVLHKHLQQHLYNQSGANSNLTGTKIITAGPEIQIPLKLDTKNPCYVNYQNANATSDRQQESLDPVGHLIALNNVRGLALFQGKDRQPKKHGIVSGMNSPFYQEVPPRLNARLPPYESHDQQLMESDWSKHVLSNHMSEGPSTNPDSSKLLHQRILQPSHYRNTEFASKDNIASRGMPHSENCQASAGQKYRLTGCVLDGRDENGYKTSCFCAEHCFPPEELSGDGHFEDPAFGHTSPPLRQQLNGANRHHQTPHEIDRLMFRQQKILMQQQQQHLLQQQQLLLRQQQQKHFLPLGVEPLCDHPECRENLRKLQTYNKHLGRFLDSEDALGDDMDASKPINVRLMLQQRHQDELKQHLQHQIIRQQMQVMKAREQQQRIRDENHCMLNNSQRCTGVNGRIVEDFADMNLDDAKDRPNHLNIKVNSKMNNHCHHNNSNLATEKNHCIEAVDCDEQTSTEISATEYTSNIVGNEETFLITSPIPVRKNRGTVVPPTTVTTTTTLPSKTSDKPPTISESGRMRYYPARAFKFYMEQHVEKVMQYYEDRRKRKQQLEKEMSDMEMEHSDRAEFRNLLAIKESNHLRLRRTKMDQSAFKKLANLGGGAFGNVFLVRKKDSGFLYAMKCMRKKDVWNKKQIAHVKAERDILAEADNRWVVKLYFSFQDSDYLYLVMEYIPGGDLMGLLMKKGIFEHELAQFYIAELVLAIESVHRLGFIHRDIKPDNILINRNGHIKLTDFGLCTGFHWTHDSDYYREDKSTSPNSRLRRFEQMRDRSKGAEDREEGLRRKIAKSLVGTPNYIAPEVLLQSGYTSCCDWWSVGVILYEMRFGQPPFRADTPLETQRKVINWQTTLRYPEMNPRVSRETIDLISRLCCAPENRLGSREGGAGDIKSHSFFAGIHFETLHSIDAPYIPRLQGSTDLSHFDAAKPLQKPEQVTPRYRGGGCKYERCPSTCSSPPSSPHHHFQCNNNYYEEDPRSLNKKAKLPPSYRSKPPRRSDSADSLYHSNGMAVLSAGSHRHRSPGGGRGSRNGGNDYGADGSGGEESFTKHDFFDFTFRRFFDNESEATS